MSATGKAARVGRGIPRYPGREVLEQTFGPILAPTANRIAGIHVQRLLGYWVMARAFGGRDALIEQGILSRSGAYKSEKEFREAFGCTPEELTLDQVFPELSE